MRSFYSQEYAFEMLVVSVVLTVAVLAGLAIYATIHRLANRPVAPIDDREACIACGSSEDRVDVAPGVYSCLCGYEGGPGMRAWQWDKRCRALAELPADARERKRVVAAERAREAVAQAEAALAQATPHIVDGDSKILLTDSGRAAARQAFREARNQLAAARAQLHVALADAEVASHLAAGTGLLDEWRDRIDGGHGVLSGVGEEVSASLYGERDRVLRICTAMSALYST